jgi:hypothetical protein
MAEWPLVNLLALSLQSRKVFHNLSALVGERILRSFRSSLLSSLPPAMRESAGNRPVFQKRR